MSCFFICGLAGAGGVGGRGTLLVHWGCISISILLSIDCLL